MSTRITIVTKDDCALCDHAKEVIARVGDEFDIELELVGLETARGREVALQSGMVFPPAVLVDGQPFAYGRLSERQLRRALAQRPVTPSR